MKSWQANVMIGLLVVLVAMTGYLLYYVDATVKSQPQTGTVVVQQPASSQAADTSGPGKFEYEVHTIACYSNTNCKDQYGDEVSRDLESYLAELGRDGWSLASIQSEEVLLSGEAIPRLGHTLVMVRLAP